MPATSETLAHVSSAASSTSPPLIKPDEANTWSEDTLFNGVLICRQSRQGYRFSVDAVLAAQFAVPKPDWQVLDLGCGCGVMGLILAYRHAGVRVLGIELQQDSAALATENAFANGFDARFSVLQGDVRHIKRLLDPECCELVLCNPPYHRAADGRLSQGQQAAQARHELNGSLEDFVRAAAFGVKNKGRVIFVYPATRACFLLGALQRHQLVVKRLQPVYSRPGATKATLLLVEASKNGGEQLDFLAPFYIYAGSVGAEGRQARQYSPEMLALYTENMPSPISLVANPESNSCPRA